MSEDEKVESGTENNEESGQTNEVEEQAKRLGWVPQEEFKGNQEQWRDAETFIERGKEIQGYLKKDLERLQTTLSLRDREIAEIRSTMEEFRTFHNETEARAYKRAIEELKQLKVSAIEQGDGAKVVELDEQLDLLKTAQNQPKSKPAVSTASQEVINGQYIEWAAENKWYAEDPELATLADDFGEVVKKHNPNLVGKAFLEEVTKKVRKAAPEKFENPNRSQSTVGTSSDNRAAGGKRKKGYSDLPADAKSACDKFVKQGLLTVDQNVKEYEWE